MLFFDKTGTLTIGEPLLRKIIVHEIDSKEGEMLRIAASLERHSIHPLAKVLVKEQESKGKTFLVTHAVKEVFGEGISGTIGGRGLSFEENKKKRR